MASDKQYLDFILEQLSELDDITYKAMMGEYIICYQGKIVGGIYDDRFLVKPVKHAIELMPNAEYELPYEGAKEMLLVDEVENKEFLAELLNAMYDELPAPKVKRKKSSQTYVRSTFGIDEFSEEFRNTDHDGRIDRDTVKRAALMNDSRDMPETIELNGRQPQKKKGCPGHGV